jgi:hypothetical protein
MKHLEQYNIVWDSQSRHSGESMPVGGHDIGLNVWVEKGDVLSISTAAAASMRTTRCSKSAGID